MGNAKYLALGADLHFPGASVSKGYAHVPTQTEILMNPTRFFFPLFISHQRQKLSIQVPMKHALYK